MATRMQQRRGTAAQWISTNSGNGPVLNSGEIGFESDTNKFKIGDGVNHWINLDYFADTNSTVNPAFGSSITFEGATDNAFETTLVVTDPTADRTITIPNATGTIVLADGSGNVTVSGDLTVSGTTTTINSTTINATTGIVFEGATANDFETTLTVTDPTADRTITFPDATGTVALTSDIAELSQDAIDAALTAGTGITKTYNDSTNTLTIAVDTTAIQAKVANVDDTEIGYLNGVTSAVQTQLDDKSTASKTETLTNKSISLGSNTVTSTLAQLNTAVTDADLATLAGTETLTNKTLTSPTVSGLTLSDSGIVFEGATANNFETTLTVTDPTADQTLTLPNSTGTLATEEYVDGAVSGAEVNQSTLAGTGISWNAGTSKFDVDTTTIQARVTDVSDTEIGYLNGVTSAIQTQLDDKSTASKTETLTNKTLTSPVINTPTGITKSDVGLGNLDNTSDANKPVSTATQTALDLKAPLASPALTGTATAVNLTISGDLTVNGTTTNINSTSLVVEDKNIVLGDAATPTDTTADGGGITLKGATDKTFNWVDATDAWTSSEHINLASGKSLYLNGTLLKDATETLTNKTLTSPVINTPTGITKSDVGLANVDNTTDANKPVSTATQTALDLKLASATAATTYETITNVALKAPAASPTFTGTVTLPQGKLTGGSTTVSANTATTVSTVALADFTTMEYTVSIKQGSKIRSSKVLVQTDGTAVDSVEHSILETGGTIAGINVTAAVVSTNAVLRVTATDAATTNAVVKVVNTII